MPSAAHDGTMTWQVVNGTTQVVTGPTYLGVLVVLNAGVGASIDIYDAVGTSTNQRWTWATANGVGRFIIRVPMDRGIRVVCTLGGAEAYLVYGV